ncbi:MAG: high-potential iron-sulfur protein [Myxococcota bacterium]
MSDEKLNRRDFFRRAAAVGASVAGAGMLLSACKDGGGAAKGGDKSGGGEEPAAGGDKGGSGELDCTDTSGLTEAEKKTRESLQYVDKSPKDDKFCDNCSLYTKPEKEGECGGCTVVAGPIHPKGYCASWAPMS